MNQLQKICLPLLPSLMMMATLAPAHAARQDANANQTADETMPGETTASTTLKDAISGTVRSLTASAKTPVLQGGVNHVEQLPGLDEALQVGRVYSDDLLIKSSTQSNNEWFFIPPWFAGTRHTEEAMIVYRYDYSSGKTTTPMQKQLNRQESLSGFQCDRNGGIWDYKRVPTIQHVESNFCNAVLYIKQITPITGGRDRLVIKYVEVSISVDKRSNKILQVVQQEQINTITSPMPGVLRTDVSVKTFGWDGKPKIQEQSVVMANIVKPFEQINQYEGQDLRPLFCDYLISQHLENLIPVDLENKAH